MLYICFQLDYIETDENFMRILWKYNKLCVPHMIIDVDWIMPLILVWLFSFRFFFLSNCRKHDFSLLRSEASSSKDGRNVLFCSIEAINSRWHGNRFAHRCAGCFRNQLRFTMIWFVISVHLHTFWSWRGYFHYWNRRDHSQSDYLPDTSAHWK